MCSGHLLNPQERPEKPGLKAGPLCSFGASDTALPLSSYCQTNPKSLSASQSAHSNLSVQIYLYTRKSRWHKAERLGLPCALDKDLECGKELPLSATLCGPKGLPGSCPFGLVSGLEVGICNVLILPCLHAPCRRPFLQGIDSGKIA